MSSPFSCRHRLPQSEVSQLPSVAYRGPHQLTAALSAHPLHPCLADGLPLYALQPRPVPPYHPPFSLQKPEPSAQIQATAGPRPEDISDLVLDMAFWEGGRPSGMRISQPDGK